MLRIAEPSLHLLRRTDGREPFAGSRLWRTLVTSWIICAGLAQPSATAFSGLQSTDYDACPAALSDGQLRAQGPKMLRLTSMDVLGRNMGDRLVALVALYASATSHAAV